MSALPTHITSGRDAGVLAREQRARAPEAGRDLVEHQQQAVLVAQRAQQRHARGRVKAHAARALHDRLDDHRGQLVGVARDELAARRAAQRSSSARVEAVGRALGEHVLGEHAGEQAVHAADRVAHAPSRRRCRRGSRRARSAGACARRCPRARWYCRHILIATSTETEPESAKNTRSRPAGASSTQALGQAHRRLVREPAEHHVRHALELLAHRRVERRVAVAVDRAPPRGHPVDQLAPVGELQAHALGRDDRQRRQRRGQRAVGMPDALAVEREQLRPSRLSAGSSPRRG